MHALLLKPCMPCYKGLDALLYTLGCPALKPQILTLPLNPSFSPFLLPSQVPSTLPCVRAALVLLRWMCLTRSRCGTPRVSPC